MLRATFNNSNIPKSFGSLNNTESAQYPKYTSNGARLAGQLNRVSPLRGRSHIARKSASATMSRKETSNPRVVPRYHSRLTKFTFSPGVSTIIEPKTSAKNPQSRTRREYNITAVQTGTATRMSARAM